MNVSLPICDQLLLVYFYHRRRMETEAKAKVVSSVWGAAFIKFLAALAVLPRSIWKKRLNSSYYFKQQNSQRGKELNKFCRPNRCDDLCLCFSLHPSSIPTTLPPTFQSFLRRHSNYILMITTLVEKPTYSLLKYIKMCFDLEPKIFDIFQLCMFGALNL